MSEESNIESLISEAKDLGIEHTHLMKEETLIRRIAEAKEPKEEPVVIEDLIEQPVRKTAPSMNVSGIAKDMRTELIAKLEAEDPECKYVFKRGSTTDAQLQAIGLERTEHTLKNDIVCRTLKSSFKNWQKVQNKSQLKSMQRIDGGTGKVGNLTASAKAPAEREEDDDD